MKVYTVFAANDLAFTNKLATDLQKRNFTVSLELPSPSIIEQEMRSTDVILVALSEALTENPDLLEVVEFARQNKRRIIALRIGTITRIPDAIRGTLPVDFSNDEFYQESLLTLLEDLDPPTAKLPRGRQVLPQDLRAQLDSPNNADRMAAIQSIADMHHTFDEDARQYVAEHLRTIAFRDKNSSVKTLARSTIQLLSQKRIAEAETDLEAQTEPPPQPMIDTAESEDTLPRAPQAEPSIGVSNGLNQQRQVSNPTQYSIIYSRAWQFLPIVGITLAVLQAVFKEEPIASLPIALVWLLLPWFNIAIRDGGKLDWKMPGPLVANTIFGLLLALVGSVIAVILGDLRSIDILILIVLGGVYGGFIGWLSSLFVRE